MMEEEEQLMGRHRPFLVFTFVLCCVSFLALQTVNILGSLIGIFVRGPDNVTDNYPVDLTPSKTVLSVWTVLYFWHAAILFYCLTAMCRKTFNRNPVYTSPTLLSYFFFVYLSVGYMLTMAWLIMWDRLLLTTSVVVMFGISASLHLALIVSYRKLCHFSPKLRELGRSKDKWIIILVVQNGVAGYAAWTAVLFYANLAVSIVYWNAVPAGSEMASLICIVVMAAHYLVYVITDLTVLHRYSAFVLAPYIVIIAALAGILQRNWKPGKTNAVIIVVFLAVSIACALIKCVRMILNLRKPKGTSPSIPSINSNNKGSNSSTGTGLVTTSTNETSLSGADPDTDLDDITTELFELPKRRNKRSARVSDTTVDILPTVSRSANVNTDSLSTTSSVSQTTENSSEHDIKGSSGKPKSVRYIDNSTDDILGFKSRNEAPSGSGKYISENDKLITPENSQIETSKSDGPTGNSSSILSQSYTLYNSPEEYSRRNFPVTNAAQNSDSNNNTQKPNVPPNDSENVHSEIYNTYTSNPPPGNRESVFNNMSKSPEDNLTNAESEQNDSNKTNTVLFPEKLTPVINNIFNISPVKYPESVTTEQNTSTKHTAPPPEKAASRKNDQKEQYQVKTPEMLTAEQYNNSLKGKGSFKPGLLVSDQKGHQLINTAPHRKPEKGSHKRNKKSKNVSNKFGNNYIPRNNMPLGGQDNFAYSAQPKYGQNAFMPRYAMAPQGSNILRDKTRRSLSTVLEGPELETTPTKQKLYLNEEFVLIN